MKRMMNRIMIAIAVAVCLCAQALAMPEALVPVGRTVGIHLRGEMTVAALEDGAGSSGVQVGDRIVSMNGIPAESVDRLRDLIGRGEWVLLGIERGGEQLEIPMAPKQTEDGARLGLRIREGITGVGTVTFYDPQTGAFGALGHGVNDPETGRRIKSSGGSVMDCRVTEVTRGKTGAPGELRGAFSRDHPVGSIAKNCGAGIFGTMTSPETARQPIPPAQVDTVHEGAAKILSNVSGDEVDEFSIEVLKIDKKDNEGRNFLLQVRDSDLISRTGGIVQGMSGSPIIQDGRLIGAVTHVLVDDPTIGYGISIESMLEAAEAACTSSYLKTFFESWKFLLSNRHNYYRIGGK